MTQPTSRGGHLLLSHIEAAVHVEDVAGDVGRHRRAEEQCGVDDIFGIAQSPEWNLLLEIFRYFVGHPFAHADIDEAWSDRIHGNVLPRKLTGGDLGERDDRSLARRVISLARKGPSAR